jgi:hypothetical protein
MDHGAIGSDGRFAIFPDKETGSRAADALLGSYIDKGTDTPNAITEKWTPASENGARTGEVAARMAKMLGISGDTKISAAQIAQINKFKAGEEGSGDSYVSDKQLPDAARQANGGGMNATVGGAAQVTLIHPGGARQDVHVPLSGRFHQRYAGVQA